MTTDNTPTPEASETGDATLPSGTIGAVAADGTFRSGSLPTTSTDDYSIRFEPPTGFTLADAQQSDNPAFALPRGEESPSLVDVARSFALISDTAAPTPSPTATGTPTPTPTATPTPTPMPSTDPVQQAYIAVFQRPDDVGLTGALSGISESELADLGPTWTCARCPEHSIEAPAGVPGVDAGTPPRH